MEQPLKQLQHEGKKQLHDEWARVSSKGRLGAQLYKEEVALELPKPELRVIWTSTPVSKKAVVRM